MTQPVTTWDEKLPDALRQRLILAIESGSATDRDLYTSLDLQRYCGLRAFQHWAKAIRDRKRPGAGPAPSAESSTVPAAGDASSLLSSCLQAVADSVLRGDAKLYELTGAVKALVTLEQLKLAGNADKRAADKHAAWQKEYRAKQDAALVELSDRLTPEQVAEIRLKVLGL